MDSWFRRQARKAWQQRIYLADPASILGMSMDAIKEEAEKDGVEVQMCWLEAAYKKYCLSLAQGLTLSGKVNVSRKESKEEKGNPDEEWIEVLFGDDILVDSRMLRQGCPIRENNDHAWSFLHASLLDYFMTQQIVDQLVLPRDLVSKGKEKLARSHDQAVRLLTHSHLSNDQVRFLVDRVKDEFKLQEALFTLIERSKEKSRYWGSFC